MLFRSYARSVELDPKYVDPRTNLGLLLLEKGVVPEALAHLAEAARLAPDRPETLSAYGTALAMSGRFGEAEAVFGRALTKATDPALLATLHFNLGNAAMASGRTDQAAKEFALAVQFDARNAAAHFNLGVALLRLGGRNTEAAAQLEEALRLDPGLTPARTMLAELRRSQPAAK